jgi:acetate kinase
VPAAARRTVRPVLVLNAGSSNLKASLVDPGSTALGPATTLTWKAESDGRQDVDGTLETVLAKLRVDPSALSAVGHRVVHGGETFRAPVVLDDRVVEAIDELGPLAPLHNPLALRTIRAARLRLDGATHVAAFDTAFHATLPETAWRYPLPRQWSAWGIRRFGFHGLSVQWATERAALMLGRGSRRLRIVVAHLGGGCSITAVDRGQSVWTSMGLTPLDGTMMATRPGALDPGILLRILRERHLDLDQLDAALERQSGLLAIGGSTEMRTLLERERAHDDSAQLAVAMFVDRTAAAIAAAFTRLESVDALVFTAGIGENAASIRSRVCRRLAVVGVPPVPGRSVSRDAVISGPARRPAVLRIAAREDIVIARAATRLARKRR